MDDIVDSPLASDIEPLYRPDVHAMRLALLGDRSLCGACLRVLLREFDDRILTIDAATAAEALRTGPVDVALLPLFRPQDSALSQAAAAVRQLDSTPLAVLTDRPDPQIVERLRALGVRGILTLDLEPRLLIAALRLVAAGGVYMSPALSAADPAAAAAPSPAARAHAGEMRPASQWRLSRREHSVLALLRNSMSNREIAAALGIAEATVKIHMRNLLRKTGARNRVELALLAVQNAA